MKKKLLASLTSLVLAFVMLTSASFAWFTVSTAPEVQDIDVTMKATRNLEIAKAGSDLSTAPDEVKLGNAGDETKWGAAVTSFEATVHFPATVTNASITTIVYDAAGRVAPVASNTVATLSSFEAGVAYYTANIQKASTTNGKFDIIKPGVKVAAVFGVWLRSNVDCKGTNAVKVTITEDGNTLDSKWAVVLADSSGKALADNQVELTANTATAVQVIVFVNGDKATSSDVAKDMKAENLKLVFNSATVTDFAAQHS